MSITSIHSSYRVVVARYLAADRKLVDTEETQNRVLDTLFTQREIERAEDKNERVLDKLINNCYEHWNQLPKREQVNIDRQYKAQYGYGCQLGAL